MDVLLRATHHEEGMQGVLQGGRMTDLEPVEPGAILPRGARPVLPAGRWPAAGLSRSRTIVASGIRALTRGPLLPVSALTVTVVAAAKAAGMAARLARRTGAPVGAEVTGDLPGTAAPDATLQVSWTHVEMRWRW
jgi:hypothetical protein